MNSFPSIRPRRLRSHKSIRNLVEETQFSVSNLIYPLFVSELTETKEPIASMPGCFRHSQQNLITEIQEAYDLGLRMFAIFPVIKPEKKSEIAHEAINPAGLIPETLRLIKAKLPEAVLIADIALDPFTSHGHDGLLASTSNNEAKILNDETVDMLCKMACILASAGADIVAPSDMMDGRIAKIRAALDEDGQQETLILSYAAKFASAFYGPFREAVGSTLKNGDKKTYQLNPANAREAEKEILLDQNEGADLLMVKPGLPYLDMVYRAAQISHLPILAYAVSGEYSMIKAASQLGFIDEEKTVIESMIAFRRAGASGIFTYHAKEIAQWLKTA